MGLGVVRVDPLLRLFIRVLCSFLFGAPSLVFVSFVLFVVRLYLYPIRVYLCPVVAPAVAPGSVPTPRTMQGRQGEAVRRRCRGTASCVPSGRLMRGAPGSRGRADANPS